ncbi:MAG: dihydroxyacetone kinase subunit DhaL [Eubacteriales bacterium]|nr:dihydroxyacetone kinase subunit DhaL [Eubacteriales bacterium]
MLIKMIEAAARKIEANEAYLNELDAVMGDGEHGSNMKKCFEAVREALPAWEGQPEAQILKNAGMKLLTAGGGTATTLLGFFTVKAAGCVQERENLKQNPDTKEIAAILNAALEATQEKSKAQPGDKTMMDAMIPAVKAFDQAAGEGCTVEEALRACAEAAAEGMEATKQMVAKRGRGFYVGERGVGTPDPGAVSVALITSAFSEYFRIF